MLKRKIYDSLLAWKKRSNGKSALLIDGARRVGKSYITKEFATREYKSHIIIDFGNAPKDVLSLNQEVPANKICRHLFFIFSFH